MSNIRPVFLSYKTPRELEVMSRTLMETKAGITLSISSVIFHTNGGETIIYRGRTSNVGELFTGANIKQQV